MNILTDANIHSQHTERVAKTWWQFLGSYVIESEDFWKISKESVVNNGLANVLVVSSYFEIKSKSSHYTFNTTNY